VVVGRGRGWLGGGEGKGSSGASGGVGGVGSVEEEKRGEKCGVWGQKKERW